MQRSPNHVLKQAEASALWEQGHTALWALARVGLPHLGMHRTKIDTLRRSLLTHGMPPRLHCLISIGFDLLWICTGRAFAIASFIHIAVVPTTGSVIGAD